MKTLVSLLILIISSMTYADTPPVITAFDAKVYSLKSKGVKDFIVDVSSSKLTKQINDQMMFGKVKEVVFRIYWTFNPERIDIEVLGLPDGFKEIKEELKITVLGVLEGLLPPTTSQRYAGYKLVQSANTKEVVATDTTGIASIPSYVLQFDNQERLSNVVAKKHVGSMSSSLQYEKTGFSDGKWVLMEIKTTNEELGQTLEIYKKYSYGSVQGIGVLKKVMIKNEQRKSGTDQSSVSNEEVVEFENYKINTGEAFKHFLGNESK